MEQIDKTNKAVERPGINFIWNFYSSVGSQTQRGLIFAVIRSSGSTFLAPPFQSARYEDQPRSLPGPAGLFFGRGVEPHDEETARAEREAPKAPDQAVSDMRR